MVIDLRVRVLLGLVGLAVLTGCNRDEASDDAADPSASTSEAATESSDGPPDPCTWTRGTMLIDGLRLESDDGACRLYLPASPTPGALTVRVSRAGDDTAAAVERDSDDGTLYATAGSVQIESVDGDRIVGRVDARDETPPGTGSVGGSFDVTLGGAQ